MSTDPNSKKDIFEALVAEFMTAYGVSEPTAHTATDMAVRLMARHPDDVARRKFNESVQEAYERREGWACEWMACYLSGLLPAAKQTYAAAIAAHRDPVPAICGAHQISPAAAVEVVAMLKAGA